MIAYEYKNKFKAENYLIAHENKLNFRFIEKSQDKFNAFPTFKCREIYK